MVAPGGYPASQPLDRHPPTTSPCSNSGRNRTCGWTHWEWRCRLSGGPSRTEWDRWREWLPRRRQHESSERQWKRQWQWPTRILANGARSHQKVPREHFRIVWWCDDWCPRSRQQPSVRWLRLEAWKHGHVWKREWADSSSSQQLSPASTTLFQPLGGLVRGGGSAVELLLHFEDR